MTGNGVSIYQLQKTEGEKSTQIAGEEKGTPGGFLPGNTLPVQKGHWKGPSPKSRPWSRWLLQSWKAYMDFLVLLSGVVTHHCPPSRDCGDRQHPRDERTAMQMLRAYQRAGTRGGAGKSLSAGSEGDAKHKWAPSTVVRKKGQFWFRVSDVSQQRPSCRRQWGKTCRFIYCRAFLVCSQQLCLLMGNRKSWIHGSNVQRLVKISSIT